MMDLNFVRWVLIFNKFEIICEFVIGDTNLQDSKILLLAFFINSIFEIKFFFLLSQELL